MTPPDAGEFWQAAAALLERPGVTRSTMMGYPCLRLHGDFFASYDPHHHALIVKLDRTTVGRMLDDGQGSAFAPSGRPFREWISIPSEASRQWPAQLDVAFEAAVERATSPRTRKS